MNHTRTCRLSACPFCPFQHCGSTFRIKRAGCTVTAYHQYVTSWKTRLARLSIKSSRATSWRPHNREWKAHHRDGKCATEMRNEAQAFCRRKPQPSYVKSHKAFTLQSLRISYQKPMVSVVASLGFYTQNLRLSIFKHNQNGTPNPSGALT